MSEMATSDQRTRTRRAVPTRLDILIPTLRRPALLRATLISISRAEPARRLQFSVVIVNNDVTPELPGLSSVLAALPFPIRILHQPQPGKSAALNAGIAASTADYIAILDDDEELSANWFRILEDALDASDVDFVGGPTLPLSPADIPDWVPASYAAVLGLADCCSEQRRYGPTFPGVLMGGNAVISRTMLARVGPYSPDLGPRHDRRLFSCEDEDMYWRLIDAGARGQYLPRLVIRHYIHRDRLRMAYYRAWCFWNGASKGVLNRRRRSTVPHIAGVPRYAFGDALRGLWSCLRAILTRGPAHVRASGELPFWHLAGQLYGRHVISTKKPPPAAAGQPKPYEQELKPADCPVTTH
jgi:glycosyltransferase involved in cell wall biosynthesis